LKICSKCKINKKNSEFNKHSKTVDKLQPYCKPCQKTTSHEYHKTKGANKQLKLKYNISMADKEKMIARQGFACSICRNSFDNPRSTHLDHCHTTNQIRGILCNRCNHGIGQFKDSPELLRFAAIYLEYHAQKNKTTQIPTRNGEVSKNYPAHGTVHGTWSWQDGDGANYNIRNYSWHYTNSSTEEGSGVSMGAGVPEVGAPEAPQGGEGNGDTNSTVGSVEEFFGRVRDKFRELDVVAGSEPEVRLPNLRRVKSVQRPKHKKVQGIEEVLKIFQAEVDIDWDAVATRISRPVESSRYTGFGPEVGDKPHKI
jgi:hypothetical protein